MIVLFGSVGSGKTEQGDRLMKHLACTRVSTSQLLRANSDPEHLKKIAEGTLVDDQDVIDLLAPELERIGADRNEFVMDGSPRSIPQAEWMDEQIKAGRIKFTAVIHLKVNKDTVVERLMKRGREDDTEEVIRHRLDEYDKITTPVLDYLNKHGYHIHEVDGELPPDEVEQQIINILQAK